jgi:thymidylate synthase
MRFAADTLDDVLRLLYRELLDRGAHASASRGNFSEMLGVLLEISLPRARLSRSEMRGKLYSALGELLWYLTEDNRIDFIHPYISRYRDESEDYGRTAYGGYGPRLFKLRGIDQIRTVIALLTERPTSRRAVVQLFQAEDIATHHKEIPCTIALQFLNRDRLLHLIATMRSNDAYIGLPHDVFCFTMLQEIVARALGLEIGCYRHFVGSMHLYDCHRDDAAKFVDEGFQARVEMPPMPVGDPWPSIQAVLAAEPRARSQERFEAAELGVDPYWADLLRLLQVFFTRDDDQYIKTIADKMTFSRYRNYILSRLSAQP